MTEHKNFADEVGKAYAKKRDNELYNAFHPMTTPQSQSVEEIVTSFQVDASIFGLSGDELDTLADMLRKALHSHTQEDVENYKNKLRQYGYGDMLDTFEKQLKENEAQAQKAITI